MNARIALFILVGLTVLVALIRFFEQNWVLGVAAATVVAGTGFIGASMHLAEKAEGNPHLTQTVAKVRAIGFIVIGLGTLFGALMLLL